MTSAQTIDFFTSNSIRKQPYRFSNIFFSSSFFCPQEKMYDIYRENITQLFSNNQNYCD